MKARSEHVEACYLFRRIIMLEKSYPEFRLLFHVGNESPTASHRKKMSLEGVRPGVSDYILLHAAGGFHGMVLELKSETGKPSKDQKAFLRSCSFAGYYAVIAYSAEESEAAFMEYANEQVEKPANMRGKIAVYRNSIRKPCYQVI